MWLHLRPCVHARVRRACMVRARACTAMSDSVLAATHVALCRNPMAVWCRSAVAFGNVEVVALVSGAVLLFDVLALLSPVGQSVNSDQ